MRRLVEQVRGSAVVDSDHGTLWTIKIPVENLTLPLNRAGAWLRRQVRIIEHGKRLPK